MGAVAERADERVRADDSVLYLAGTGTFALELLEYARAAGREVVGLIELIDRDRIGTVVHGQPVIGPEARPSGAARAVIAVGGARMPRWAQLTVHGWTAGTIVHPRAAVSPSSEIAPGAVIGPLAVIGAATLIGAQTLVGRGSTVGHHVTLGPGVVINPGANVGGNTTIGEDCQVGIGATVVNAVQIGAGAVIAAGSVVVRDVPEDVRVQGVPARVYRENGVRP
ncbi:MAG: DapH/DapD/GlmU-related protein [Solirubrobacteraceae bacterium]